jgi:nucleotide-binding universal stress UspA family protein
MTPTTPAPASKPGASAGGDVVAAAHASVLVPLDGSALSERALEPARWLADRLGAQVHTVTVTYGDESGWYDQFAHDLRERWPQVVPHHAVRPTATVGISAVANDLPGALVCMATHGRARTAAVLGSTFTSLARSHPAPLVAVGPDAAVLTRRADRIVVCVDGTPSSERALPLAASWALRLGTRLDLIAVTESKAPFAHGEHRHPAWQDNPSAYLATLARHPELAGVEVRTDVLIDPLGPAQAISDLLFWHPAQLVVTASHLRTNVDRALHGSTTAQIIRSCPIPVLVQPAVQPESPPRSSATAEDA